MNWKYVAVASGIIAVSLGATGWSLYTSPWFLWGMTEDYAGKIYTIKASIVDQNLRARQLAEIIHVTPITWPEITWERIKGGFRMVLHAAKDRRLPIRPTLIAQSPSGKIIAQEERSEEVVESSFVVSIPGSFISSFPKEIEDEWNEYIINRLGFTYTKPKVVKELAKYREITVSTARGDDSNIVLKTSGDPKQWQAAVVDWIKNEQAYRQPVTAAFRLPDGTIGYEKRPAERISTNPFSLGTESPGCTQDQSLDKPLFFCQSGSTSFVTTRMPGLFSSSLFSATDSSKSWEIFLDKDILTGLKISGIKAIKAFPEDDIIKIVIHTD